MAGQYSHMHDGPGVAPGEATAMMYGLVHGLHDAWTVAYRSFKAGAPLSGLGRETSIAPAATAENLGIDPQSVFGKSLNFYFNYLGSALLPGLPTGGRLATRALMTVDEFFKMLAYRMELNAQAYRSASREGYEGTAWAEHVQRVVSQPNLGELQQAAHDFSVLQTFQGALEPNSIGGKLQSVADFTFQIPFTEAKFPAGRVLLPYVQTPANLLRYSLERTPMLNMLLSSHRADLQAGGVRADMAHAKTVMGTMASLAMMGLAVSGRLTGRGPEDRDLRAIWLQSFQPYSVRVPFTNRWVSIERFEPISTFAKLIGDMHQSWDTAHVSEWERYTIVPTLSFMRGVVSPTYFQSLSQFFDIMSPDFGATEDDYGRKLLTFTKRRGGQLAQPSAVVASTARALDPYEKESFSLMDGLYERLPGWRSGVANRRTIGGEKMLYGWGFEPDVLSNTLRAYLPFKLSSGAVASVDKEIQRHKMSLGRSSHALFPHGLPAGQLAQGDVAHDPEAFETLRLTPHQYERRVVLESGNQAEAEKLGLEIPTPLLASLVEGLSYPFAQKPPRGVLSLDDYTDWLIDQPEYRAATSAAGGGKEAMFKQAVQQYRAVGKALLLAQDDALREQYEESRLQQGLQQVPMELRPQIIDSVRTERQRATPGMKQELGLRVGAPR